MTFETNGALSGRSNTQSTDKIFGWPQALLLSDQWLTRWFGIKPGVANNLTLLSQPMPKQLPRFPRVPEPASNPSPTKRSSFLKLREVADFEPAFATLVQQKIVAVLVIGDSFFVTNGRRLVDLAARSAIPTMYPWRDFADAGGLLSYGDSLNDAHRRIGLYASRILKGDKAGDLPVWVPTKFELALNLKTAKTLGVAMPASLLAFADEVIE